MKKFILSAAIMLSAAAFAGVGATTNWVARYVESRVSEIEKKIQQTQIGNSTAFTYSEGGISVSNVVEELTVGGLIVADCAPGNAYAITNGMIFAWNGTGYQHGANTIAATKTALSIGSYSTIILDGGCWLADPATNRLCRLRSTLLQQSVANKAIEGK